MPIIAFNLLFLIAIWAVLAVSYEAAERWPIIGRFIEEPDGLYLVGIAVLILLAVLLGALGVEIQSDPLT
jgi:hypothetical protein